MQCNYSDIGFVSSGLCDFQHQPSVTICHSILEASLKVAFTKLLITPIYCYQKIHRRLAYGSISAIRDTRGVF